MGNNVAENFLRPALGQLLELYLKIMDEVDSEDLVGALEGIMTVFSDDIAPHAVNLVTKLIE